MAIHYKTENNNDNIQGSPYCPCVYRKVSQADEITERTLVSNTLPFLTKLPHQPPSVPSVSAVQEASTLYTTNVPRLLPSRTEEK